MKKIIITSIAASIVFLFPALVGADEKLSVENELNNIKQSQKIEQNSEIKCDKVTDEQFEKLGDAVMGVMHPNEDEHELMDQMMGGEGSNSLKAMHIAMGKKYLNCWSGGYGSYGGLMGTNRSGGGMMGFGMMGGDYFGNGYGMMGSYGYGWIFMILFWIVIVVGAIYLIKLLVDRNKSDAKSRTAIEILKERYAKGEIDKEEFEEKKKSLM